LPRDYLNVLRKAGLPYDSTTKPISGGAVAEPQIKEQNVTEDRFPLTALIMPGEPEPE
jgi:hypothetical protein